MAKAKKVAFPYKAAEVLKTDIIPLDIILHGGLPKPGIVELWGGTGSGKTTLALQAAKNLVTDGKKVAYFDVEDALADDRLEKLDLAGVGSEDIGGPWVISRAKTYGDLNKDIEKVLADGSYDLVVIDSITAVIPDKNPQAVGAKARDMTHFLEWVKPASIRAGTGVLLLSQERFKIEINGRRGGGKREAAGCLALGHSASVRLEMRRTPTLLRRKEGEENICYGHKATLEATKNLYGQGCIPLDIYVHWGRGASNLSFLRDQLLRLGSIEDKGYGHFKVVSWNGEDVNLRGAEGVLEWIQENVDEVFDHLNDIGGFELVNCVSKSKPERRLPGK